MFDDVEVALPARPRKRPAIFRRVPIARLMTLWTARKPTGATMPNHPSRPSCRRCRSCCGARPPGLEQILMQEGVPFRKVAEPHPLAFGAGRFVLFDGR